MFFISPFWVDSLYVVWAGGRRPRILGKEVVQAIFSPANNWFFACKRTISSQESYVISLQVMKQSIQLS